MIRYILTDIEGTTTSLDFVKEVLFPYFSAQFKAFLSENAEHEMVKTQFQMAQTTIQAELNKTVDNTEIVEYLLSWTKEDRKHAALKTLQGLVWQEGYQNGTLKGHLYADVPTVLKKWKKDGLHLGIYSSGSVQAQKLLFQHTEYGDLSPLFSHYFDTAVGNKREIESYKNIQKQIGLPAREILFLSDVEQELDSAKSAGLQTIQLVREKTTASAKHKHVANFTVCARIIAGQQAQMRNNRGNKGQDCCCC